MGQTSEGWWHFCKDMKNWLSCEVIVNSLRPSDTIWWLRAESTLVQVRTWCLRGGTKPLPIPMLTHLSSVRSNDIMRSISQIRYLSHQTTQISLNITYKNFIKNFQGPMTQLTIWLATNSMCGHPGTIWSTCLFCFCSLGISQWKETWRKMSGTSTSDWYWQSAPVSL